MHCSWKGDQMEDNDIVVLFLARNEDAISKTTEKYGVQLRKIAYGILSNHESAEECENDTYQKAWESIPPNEPRDHLFSYLGRIVRNIALNRLKAENRKKRCAAQCELSEAMAESIPSNVNVEMEVMRKELRRLIEAYLNTCTELQQKIFLRRYWYCDTIPQISLYYGISKKTVTTILSGMRKELKGYLSQGGYGV